MTGSIAIDAKSLEAMKMIEPHYDMHSTASPGQLKNTIRMPTVTTSVKAAWLADEIMVI